MAKHFWTWTIGLAALIAAPAHAGSTFSAPKGCEVYATTQLRNCQVAQHYRCEADAPGDQWMVYSDVEGPYYASRIDTETRWLESHDLISGETDRIATETDAASFSELLAKGRDDFDFTTQSDSGEVRRYVGYDQLTGESVTIDGVILERTEFELTAYDAEGGMFSRRSGRQFVQREWRLFFADREEFVNALGERQSGIDSPVEFALPGEKGFLAAKPKYDCDMMMTRQTPPLTSEGAAHDHL